MHSEIELLRLVDRGEDIQTEFKRLVHSPEKIAKSMVAFANTSGGVILVGVDDDKRIVGIKSEKEIIEIIEEAGQNFIEPEVDFDLEIVEFKGRDVLMVTVEESPDKPHFHLTTVRDPHTLKKKTERKVYIRNGSKNTAASKEIVSLMSAEKRPLRISYGENERTLFRYLDAYHRITLKEFSQLVNISSRRATKILISLVRAGVIHLHTEGKDHYYTLVSTPN
ncbi:MAG: ATP-binding protein [Chlorobiales bacterium]|nr:ATP-binding protein [Chlorobiales bacterium]